MPKTPRKIYIIGPAGSGKSTLAHKLGKKYDLPILDLDNIFWKIKYTQENTFQQKQLLLKKFIDNNQNTGWIVEGANKDFIKQTISQNPKVIWLNPNIFILFYNIVKRFIKDKYLSSNEKLSSDKSRPKDKSKNKITKSENNTAKGKDSLRNKKPDAQHTWYGLYWLLRGIISYKLHNKLYNIHKQTN
ncbi:MAG: hypothetical protein DSY82_01355, partial [Flavobacteriia bacterium]